MNLEICLKCTETCYQLYPPKRSKEYIDKDLRSMERSFKRDRKIGCGQLCHWFDARKLPPPECEYYLEHLICAQPKDLLQENVVTWMHK